MATVIKKSGKKEPFKEGKIRSAIEKALIDVGMSLEKKKEAVERIVSDVAAMSDVKTQLESSAIRTRVLNELDVLEPKVADAWRKFDKKYKGG